MGWWETGDGLTLGDGPLDELHRSLREVAGTYTNALGRPPTVAELERLLALVVDSLGAADVADLDGRTVTAVTMKVKKGQRRISYAAGDVFAVPLPDGTFGFGRVLAADAQGRMAVEFLARRSNLPVTGPEVAQEPRLGTVAEVAGFYSLGNGRWPVLLQDPGYRAPDHDELRFQLWNGGDSYLVLDLDGEVVARGLPRSEVAEDLPYADAYSGGATDYPSEAEEDLARRLDSMEE